MLKTWSFWKNYHEWENDCRFSHSLIVDEIRHYGVFVKEWDEETGNPKKFGKWVAPYWLWKFGQAILTIKDAWIAWDCDHRGTWVDGSWATPDSGGDGGHCTRCGYSFSHTYY